MYDFLLHKKKMKQKKYIFISLLSPPQTICCDLVYSKKTHMNFGWSSTLFLIYNIDKLKGCNVKQSDG